MSLRVGNCTGRCLLSVGRLRVELWRVPKGETIPPHVHKSVHSRMIFLDRNLEVHRDGSTATRATPWRRWYYVPAGMTHHAKADRGDARFINIEWCVGRNQSPAEDFIET